MRLLIRTPNWVGDALLSLPAVGEIRRRFPAAHVAVLARPHVAGLYAAPLVDEVIPYTPASGWRGLAARWRFARSLVRWHFDTAILLQNAHEAAVVAWLARIPVRIGYDRASRGRWLTHAIPVPRPGDIPSHQRYYYLELLRRAGLIDTLPDAAPTLLAPPALTADGARLDGLWLGVAPGSANGTAKRWLPDRFADAATAAARATGAQVAVFGSAEERDLCEQVAARIREQGLGVTNFSGETTVADFVALAGGCAAMLSNDSGAMHVAAALGVPAVAVFGPTDPAATGAAARIVREPVDCGPCLRHECPLDHRCMTAVSADRVAAELIEVLQAARQPGARR